MVDVADKPESRREATASGHIRMRPETLALLAEGGLPKGDVLATARIAGIQAAKRTHELIPLCHALALSKVAVDFRLDEAESCVEVTATCRLNGRTGVEMEALTAVSVACLTLYDMCKAVDKSMEIGAIQLESKSGGRSGDYRRDALESRPAPIVTGEGQAGEVSLGQPLRHRLSLYSRQVPGRAARAPRRGRDRGAPGQPGTLRCGRPQGGPQGARSALLATR